MFLSTTKGNMLVHKRFFFFGVCVCVCVSLLLFLFLFLAGGGGGGGRYKLASLNRDWFTNGMHCKGHSMLQ